jgi:hypothetical protein
VRREEYPADEVSTGDNVASVSCVLRGQNGIPAKSEKKESGKANFHIDCLQLSAGSTEEL